MNVENAESHWAGAAHHKVVQALAQDGRLYCMPCNVTVEQKCWKQHADGKKHQQHALANSSEDSIDSSDGGIFFVDTLAGCRSATRSLLRYHSRIAVDVEGEELCRDGVIALIQMAVDDGKDSRVYVFDIKVLGERCFVSVDRGGGGLRTVLESLDVEKVFFDVRADCDALYHLYGVHPNNVIDLQVLFTLYNMPPKVERLTGLGQVFEQYCRRIGVEEDERLRLRGIKERGVALFAPEKGGSYAVWFRRPLHADLLQYAAADVLYLLDMVEVFARPPKRVITHGELQKRFRRVKNITNQRMDAAIDLEEACRGAHKRFRDF